MFVVASYHPEKLGHQLPPSPFPQLGLCLAAPTHHHGGRALYGRGVGGSLRQTCTAWPVHAALCMRRFVPSGPLSIMLLLLRTAHAPCVLLLALQFACRVVVAVPLLITSHNLWLFCRRRSPAGAANNRVPPGGVGVSLSLPGEQRLYRHRASFRHALTCLLPLSCWLHAETDACPRARVLNVTEDNPVSLYVR